MTNAMIIFLESQKLAEEGKIKYTGRVFKGVNALGEECEIKETEAIHTFAVWKSLGYSVKRGQHAVASFPIWKHVAKKDTVQLEDGSEKEVDKSKMFMKVAAFFTADQVEEIKK